MVAYRNDLIKRLVKGKDTLDVGSCGVDKFFYSEMKKHTKSITGVDLEGKGDIIKGNAETVNLGKKFDVVVAGDIIEHLDNAGLFLDNMKKHLKKDGLLIISTPNVKSIAFAFFKGNKTHTAWYCKYTLSYLLRQHGFKVVKIRTCVRRKINPIYDLLRYIFANTLFVISKAD